MLVSLSSMAGSGHWCQSHTTHMAEMGTEGVSQSKLDQQFLKGGEINAVLRTAGAQHSPDLKEPLQKYQVIVNSRWHSPVVEEILGASRAEPYLPQTGSEVVREVFLEEVEFTLRPEA